MTTTYSEDDLSAALYALRIRQQAWARELTPEEVAADVAVYARGPRLDEEATGALRETELAAYRRGAEILAEARLVFGRRFAYGDLIPASGAQELGEVDSPVVFLEVSCADGRGAVQFVALRRR